MRGHKAELSFSEAQERDAARVAKLIYVKLDKTNGLAGAILGACCLVETGGSSIRRLRNWMNESKSKRGPTHAAGRVHTTGGHRDRSSKLFIQWTLYGGRPPYGAISVVGRNTKPQEEEEFIPTLLCRNRAYGGHVHRVHRVHRMALQTASPPARTEASRKGQGVAVTPQRFRKSTAGCRMRRRSALTCGLASR